jgi:hypothetical protein
MATLVATNNEPATGRLPLQPGINTIGRAEGNHHVIPHHSVSSRHCEIVVNGGGLSVRDLRSTNGTFVDGKPVDFGELAHGQHLKLGAIEFVVDAPEYAPASRGGALRINAPAPVNSVEAAAPSPVARTAREAIAAIDTAALQQPSFYRRLPGAFAYPFKGSGLLLLGLGTVFFVILAFALRLALVFQFAIRVFTFGYLFAFMQRIISSSATGEDEVPDFPDVTEIWSDIILPFLFFTGTVIVSFAPAIAVTFLFHDHALHAPILIAALAICGCYLPMALLAVAVSDNFFALSPHVVLPSIVRVAAPYLVACILLGALVAVRWGVAHALSFLHIPILPAILDGFVSLYLLIVEMRILGLLFRCYRERLRWL